jgi:hypothetical protein
MKLKTIMTMPMRGSSVTAQLEYTIKSDKSEILSLDITKWSSEDPTLTELDKDHWLEFEEALDMHLTARGELI